MLMFPFVVLGTRLLGNLGVIPQQILVLAAALEPHRFTPSCENARMLAVA